MADVRKRGIVGSPFAERKVAAPSRAPRHDHLCSRSDPPTVTRYCWCMCAQCWDNLRYVCVCTRCLCRY